MKKVFLITLVLAFCTVLANARFTQESENVLTEQVATEDYKEVALADLSENIQEAIKNLAGEVFDIKKIEFDAEKALTKVTLTNKEDNSEKSVILNKEGKEENSAD